MSDWITDEEIARVFRSHWSEIRADHWAALEDDDDTIARRVKGFARQAHPDEDWSVAITAYLDDCRLAWAAARRQPLLGPGTTAWRLAGAQFVRRMAGSYRLRDLRGACDGDWQSVQWVRLPEDIAIELQQAAVTCETTVPRLITAIVETWVREHLLD